MPLKLRHDPVFAGLTSFERDVVYSALVAQDDRHCLPFSEAGLRSEIFPERPFVALREIANARDKLVALGVFTHKRGAKREWLEIAEQYRHSEGNAETSFGEDLPAPQQAELGIVTPVGRKKINGSRRESEEKRSNDSTRAKQLPPPKESKNREACAGESGNRFATSGSEFPDDERWPRFLRCLSFDEIVERGKLWASRWKLGADTLWACASDWESTGQAGNFAAMATKAFKERWRDAA